MREGIREYRERGRKWEWEKGREERREGKREGGDEGKGRREWEFNLPRLGLSSSYAPGHSSCLHSVQHTISAF